MYTISSLQGPPYEADTSCPQIRPAGVVSRVAETAKDALSWQAPPPTPPEQKKYRALNAYEPGKIYRHYGAANDPVPQGPFGKTDPLPDSAANIMKGGYPTTDMARWQLEQQEAVYASTTREPLGRGYQRGLPIPEGMGTQRPFGMTIGAQEKDRARQALHIIFPSDVSPQPEDDQSCEHQMYVTSHGAYLPAEQRRRNYDWAKAGIDPATQRFGYTEKDVLRNGVQAALQPELDPTIQHASATVNKVLADFKLSNSDQLGQVRKLGVGERNLPSDHVYGMSSLRNGQRGPTVKELMTQALPAEQQQPDADLGKSLREGWRNIAPEGRTFGVPSIRTDVPMPTKRSVASTSNYGNEPDALQLLRPPKSVERGVREDHFMQLRSKEELRTLMQEANITLDDEQFNTVFDMAAQADTGNGDQACLDTLFRARHHLLAQQTLKH